MTLLATACATAPTPTPTATPAPTLTYVDGHFQSGGEDGRRITVVVGSSVDVYVTLGATGTMRGELKVEVWREIASPPDAIKKTCTKAVSLFERLQEVHACNFVADDLTGGSFRQYYLKVYWNGVVLYDPADPMAREAVMTVPAATPTVTPSPTPTPAPTPTHTPTAAPAPMETATPTMEPVDQGEEWKYTALGDSLATGFGAIKGYVSRYRDHIEVDASVNVELTNLGRNGWTSDDLIEALQMDPTFRASVSRSQVVTWDIGGNDLRAPRLSYMWGACGGNDNQDCLRETVVTFKWNWDVIVAEVLALRDTSGHIIRTMDIYNPFVNEDRSRDSWENDGECNDLDGDGKCSDFEVFKPYLDDVNNYIATTATNHNIPCAVVYLAFNGPNGDEDPEDKGYIAADGFHPNDTGHQVIADLLRELGYTPLK